MRHDFVTQIGVKQMVKKIQDIDLEGYLRDIVFAVEDLGFGRVVNMQDSKLPGTTEKIAMELTRLNEEVAYLRNEFFEDFGSNIESIAESLKIIARGYGEKEKHKR